MKKIALMFGLICSVLAAQVPDKPLLKVFDHAHNQQPGDNLLLSPWGIQQCYNMLSTGVGPISGKEFADTLGITPENRKDYIQAIASLSINKRIFNSFNAVFYNYRYTLQKSFIDYVIQNCRGRIFYVDMTRKDKCIPLLNDIVKKGSYNLFPEFFRAADLQDEPPLILMNVLWVNLKWAKPFMLNQTREKLFKAPGAPQHKVMMMHDSRHLPYYNDGSIHGVVLDTHDKRFKVMLLMPLQEKTPLKTVSAALAAQGWTHFVKNASAQYKTHLALPRIQLNCSNDLVKLLRNAGMKATFDPLRADMFGIIKNEPLYIAQSRQDVKLILNESGTQIAAATAAIPKMTSAAPGTLRENTFRADRPFVILVVDEETQAVLLSGVISKP